jgi:hypothetical protein
MSENAGASTSRNPKGLHGLYRDNFTFYLYYINNTIDSKKKKYLLINFTAMREAKKEKYKTLICFIPASSCFLDWLNLRPCRWRRNVPSKRLLTFNGLYGITSQKI